MSVTADLIGPNAKSKKTKTNTAKKPRGPLTSKV